jgi:hypothetical protein
MAQTGGEGERGEGIVTLGRKTQAGVVRVYKIGVMRYCISRGTAVSTKGARLQVVLIDSVKMGLAIIL